jgi:flagellin
MSVINTNVKSMIAQDSIVKNNRALETAMQRLSTGNRINSAKDDAAGLSISTRMDAQVRGLSMAIRNANDGISLMQTAEGAMDEVTNMLQRMRELAVQSVNGVNNAADRTALNDEVDQLKQEIDRIAKTTQFNNINLLDGSFQDKTLQIGDKADQIMKVGISSVATKDLGMGNSSATNNVVIGGRLGFTDDEMAISSAFATATSMSLVINGTVIDIIKSDTSGYNAGTSGGNSALDINDVITAINRSNAGVTASGFNEVVAKTAGTGVLSAQSFQITVTMLDSGSTIEYKVGETTSMADLVDKINAVGGASTVQAKLNESGKLVLFNNSGATIAVSDSSATAAEAYDGRSGFATGAGRQFQGFLKLEATNGEPISIGTTAIAVGATRTDEAAALASLGLVRTQGFRTDDGNETITDAYTVVGAAVTASDTEWAKGELNINGVDIWRSGQSTDTLAKKVDLVNSFASETGVWADVYSDDSGSTVIRLNSINNTPISIDLGDQLSSDAPGLGGYASHGLREMNVGAADFDTNEPTYGTGGGGTSLSGTNVLTEASATSAIKTIDNAIEKISSTRAKLGAYQNRLVSTVNNLDNIVTNTAQSKSRIKDTDYATETTQLAKTQIIQQAATAMLAQANQAPQSVLSLLQ